MRTLRGLILLIGAIIVSMGLLWVGQGTGLIMWPASSFMLADRQWAVNGAAFAAFGLVLIWIGLRRR